MSALGEALRQRIVIECQSRGLLPQTAPLLVGLSGGRDSVALVALLNDLRPWGQWPITVVHFDHGLRGGAAADADRNLCENLCRRLQLPFHFERLDVARDEPGLSLETAARNARLNAFRRLAVERKIPIVVTAHQADDRVETVLFRILRGTGLRGLPGIFWRRDEPVAPPPAQPPAGLGFTQLAFQRPLLGIWREELTEFLRAAGHTWNDDSTNASDAHTRNRIRRSLIPQLALDYNPAVRDHLWHLAEDAADWLAGTAGAAATDVDNNIDASALLPIPAENPAAPATTAVPAAAPVPAAPAAGVDDLEPDPLHADPWPWPAGPVVLDGATLLALGRARAIQAIQTILELARRRAGHAGAPNRNHYLALFSMLTDPAAPSQLSLPGGWQVRRAGRPPQARLLIDHP